MITIVHWIALIVTVIYVIDAAMDTAVSISDWLYTGVTVEKFGRSDRIAFDAMWLILTIVTLFGVASVPY